MTRRLDIANLPEFDNHEAVVYAVDERVGLKSFIAIHNTNLGPATGGTRYWNYASEEEAIRDVLRLSQAMTYKCALARVPYGGGKGVIIGNAHNPRKGYLFASYAHRVNLLNGTFYTGEDVGLTQANLHILEKESKFIIGRERIAGNPSPWAARGVYYAILAALQAVFGNSEIAGRTFSVKGVGKVGSVLCGLLYERGGKVFVADLAPEKIKSIKRKYPRVEVMRPLEIHKQKVDVYAPCALGGEFNKKTIPQLRCKVICGGANNQLASHEDGERLHSWDILYVPDYLANAGGLINVVAELDKRGYSRRRVERKVRGIRATTKKIIELSRKKNQPTSHIADRLAEGIFLNGKRK